MARWKIRNWPNCDLCGKVQSQIHVLNNCSAAVNEGRYKWRHDSVLKTLLSYLGSLNDFEVYADVEGYRSSAMFFNSSIPDIVLIKNNNLYAIELTICFETNFTKSRNYKINRYKNLANDVIGNYVVKKLFLEISSLGFYTNDAKPFIKFCKKLKVNNVERMLKKCSEVAIRASFFLNIRKNKEWPQPSLLSFV